MFAYDKTFDPKVVLGHYIDLISQFSEYDQTFNPYILIGHYDLISWFSDFALYRNTQWNYDHISFTL